MALLSINEVLDFIIISACVGYIFSRYFGRFNPYHQESAGFNWSDFWFSISIIVPSVVLHELGHKLVAIALGYGATFHSPISVQHIFNPVSLFTDPFALLMIIALVSTFFGVGALFFVPAFVSIGGNPGSLQSVLIAFAGPGINMLLWLVPAWLLKHNKIPHKYHMYSIITSKINKLLFIFNMIPIPGFDGSKVLVGLLQLFGMVH